MNIISRCYNILRSNLPRLKRAESWRKNSEGEKNYRFTDKDKHFSHRSRTDGDFTQPDYDPVLAEYYANLELPYGAGLKEVSKAWKRLMRNYHPDLHSNDPQKRNVANELCQGLNKAHNELVNYLNHLKSKQ